MERPSSETVQLLARYLTSIVRDNDAAIARAPLSATLPVPTRFHARNIPSIDILGYLTRILRYSPCSSDCFLALLIYLERAAGLQGMDGGHAVGWVTNDVPGQPVHLPRQPLVLTSFNIHRLLLAGMLVSVKFLSDIFYTNAHMARVGGVPVKELNRLEIEFLLLMDFDLAVSLVELEECGRKLESFQPEEEGSLEALAQVFLADFPRSTRPPVLNTSMTSNFNTEFSPSPMQELPPVSSTEGMPRKDLESLAKTSSMDPTPEEVQKSPRSSMATLANSMTSTPLVQGFVMNDSVTFPELPQDQELTSEDGCQELKYEKSLNHSSLIDSSEGSVMDYCSSMSDDGQNARASTSLGFDSSPSDLASSVTWLMRESGVALTATSHTTGIRSHSSSSVSPAHQVRLKSLFRSSHKRGAVSRRRKKSSMGRMRQSTATKVVKKVGVCMSSRSIATLKKGLTGCRLKRKRLLFNQPSKRRD